MHRGLVRRARLLMFVVVTLAAGSMLGCGDDPAQSDASAPDTADTTGADADDAPGAVLDANLPRSDVPVIQVDPPDATSEPDAYTLPENSVTTCGGFFECLQECPPEVLTCTRACHDAMTDEAASRVQRFMSCVNRHACSNEDCIMRECGMELDACFNHR